ncbi:CCHC-type domain-containing protein [Camponotus japonicus]
MESTTEGKKRTVSRGSDTLESGDMASIVPARLSSSSGQGLPSTSSAGIGGELATAETRTEETQCETLTRTASGTGLSRSGSLASLRSTRSSCGMDVDKENRKRSRAEMLDKESAKEEEEEIEGKEGTTGRKLAKRGGGRRPQYRDQGSSSAQESLTFSKKQARSVLLSDYEDADCFVVEGPPGTGNGEEDRAGTSKDGKGQTKEEFGVVLKKKRGRKRKVHRKKIGINELGVHEIEDSEDSEGYDALSAPEMAATAIEYLEEADEIRIKCKNIKGDLSGVMKRRLHNAKEIIKGLARTITKKIPPRKEGEEENDDEACFLRMENKELKTRLKEKERHCQQKEKEIHLLRNELKEISEQMKALREEVMDIKRNKGKVMSPTGSMPSRSERRVTRTLRAIEKEEDTSLADDSEAMEIDHLPALDWPTLEDSHGFKEPFPVDGRSGSTKRNPNRRSPGPGYLQEKKKEEELVEMALEESLKDIRDTRNRIRQHGNLQQTQEETKKNKDAESPKPQRTPRISESKRSQGIRKDIKVVENIQLVGPRIDKKALNKEEDISTDQDWKIKKSRRERQEEKKRAREKSKERQKEGPNKQQGKQQRMTRRPPRSAAVTLRIAEKDKDKITYASVLRKAREKISLEEIGIDKTRIRRTVGGNILIEIPGINKSAEADKLAEELHKVLETEIMISRPTIKGELRLFGIDDSITTEEIKEVIADKGSCKVTEIVIGKIGRMRNGSGMVWVKCPLNAALALSKIGKICIGWSSVRVEILGPREKQCFRCWEYGHMKYNCKSEIDRTGRCYRCGSDEHKVKECTNEAQCVICKGNNLDWHHRIGSIACTKNRAIVGRKNTQARSTTPGNVDINIKRINNDKMEIANNNDDANDK